MDSFEDQKTELVPDSQARAANEVYHVADQKEIIFLLIYCPLATF